jgi:hypothetical protein
LPADFLSDDGASASDAGSSALSGLLLEDFPLMAASLAQKV